MHHIFRRHGLRSASAKRRRTVSRDRLSCAVSLTISPASRSSVHRARPAGGFAQAVATSRASSLPVNLRWRRARLLAQSPLQVALHEPPFGAVHRRAADADIGCDLLVADAGVRRQQDPRSLEFARRLPAPAQKGSEFIALVLGQGHAITYIHGHLLFGGAVESTSKSIVWRTQTRLHATQGQYLAFIDAYTRVNLRPPAEADIQRRFGVTRRPSIRWFWPSNALASFAANRGRHAASRCSSNQKIYPSWKCKTNQSKPLCRGTRPCGRI